MRARVQAVALAAACWTILLRSPTCPEVSRPPRAGFKATPMRDALRTARAWLAGVLMPAPLVMATGLGLVHRETTDDEQDGDT